MRQELQKKVDFAIQLLKGAEQMAAKVNQPVEICYSGGKDSDVILELAKMAGINYRAIYKNTTIDPPYTIRHVIDKGVEIIRPKESFSQLLYRKGWPSRKVRFCCSELKEYKVLDYAVVGIRRDESVKRANLYKEPELCRVYSAKEKTRQYLPILEWTLDDVAEFIKERNIVCAPHYYEDGVFRPERRLGCMCCPLANKKHRIGEFRKYPNMVKMYLRGGGQFYFSNHRSAKQKEYFNDIYEWFTCYLFCDSIQEFRERFGKTLFTEPTDCKKFLEDYFKITL